VSHSQLSISTRDYVIDRMAMEECKSLYIKN